MKGYDNEGFFLSLRSSRNHALHRTPTSGSTCSPESIRFLRSSRHSTCETGIAEGTRLFEMQLVHSPDGTQLEVSLLLTTGIGSHSMFWARTMENASRKHRIPRISGYIGG